jgi:UDP-N-acetyl-D-mannosaminuronic acid transferase (WecB/TagA/CpsF family)
LICGGAILDFKARRFTRAPRFLRLIRAEWLYRLLLEPRRLFNRYVIGIPAFLLAVAKDRR